MAGTELPNYMRKTSSSGAKAGRVVGREEIPATPPKQKPVRAKVVFTKNPYVSRATCSSTMKGSGLGATGGDGHAAAHVCPYAYCSLNGHVHASVVPLRSFLASRRRLIKMQQNMKLKGVSPFRKTNNGGGEGGGGGGSGRGFFVEIYAGAGSGSTATAPTVSSNVSHFFTEEMDAMVRRMEYAMFDHRSCGDAEDKVKDLDVSVDGSCGSSDVISDGLAELGTTKSCGRREEIDEEKGTSVDQEAEDFGDCKSDISEELDAKDGGNISEDSGGDASKESSIDDISSAFGGMIFIDVGPDPIDAATCERNKFVTARRRTPEEGKQMRPFNPRAPNFLTVEPDPVAENVDLRHQMMDDRKSSEEWMVDYALRRAVKKLARAQKRKVEMLVQAFEIVLPPVPSEKKSVQHDDDKKSSTHTRPWQACS